MSEFAGEPSVPRTWRMPGGVLDGVLLSLLLISTVALAVLEVFYLPLRLDGHVLPDLGAVPAPLSLLVAAVTTPWLVSQTARTSTRLGGPAAFGALPLLLWLIVVVGIGLFGPGGDRVLPLDWRGVALLAAGALPGALVLGRVLGQASRERLREGGRRTEQ